MSQSIFLKTNASSAFSLNKLNTAAKKNQEKFATYEASMAISSYEPFSKNRLTTLNQEQTTGIRENWNMQMIAQGVLPTANTPQSPKKFDLTDMSRQEIADLGKQLFREGKITLDELLRFDHPDGKVKIGIFGKENDISPDDRINFIGETRKAIQNLIATGDSEKPQSIYPMMQQLLEKLEAMQNEQNWL